MISIPNIDQKEQQLLLESARASIESRFRKALPPDLRIPGESTVNQSLGAFVTLKKEGHLRGCIGSIIGRQALWKSVQELAKASAFEDSRFPPLGINELDSITIEISVLSELEAIDDYRKICIGSHGILLRHGSHRALFLPQVATEQGWDLDEYLSHCCRKAGLGADFWKTNPIDLEIFTAVVFSEK